MQRVKAKRTGFSPIKMTRIHKGAIIRLLQERPECFRDVCASEEFKSVGEFIAALEASPHEYFVDGVLQAYDGPRRARSERDGDES